MYVHGFRFFFTPLAGVLFAFPSRYWFTIGQSGVFSLGGWSPHIQTGYHVSRPTHAHILCSYVYESITLSPLPFHAVLLEHIILLGSFPFARRYLGNRFFFLFLRLLRCFSSPGSPPYVMDWRMDDTSSSYRVSPFRHLRIKDYLHLPAAFRSLSRLSSALSAKASTLRSFLLNLFDA